MQKSFKIKTAERVNRVIARLFFLSFAIRSSLVRRVWRIVK